MRLALQLLTFNRPEVLPPLLDSLSAQTDRDWTLYVLDNSTDDAKAVEIARLVEAWQGSVPIIFTRSADNIGFDAGHQQLYASHDADYVMCVNDDTILASDYIARLRRLLDVEPKVAAVAGQILRMRFSPTGEWVKTNIVDSLGLAKTPWHRVYDIHAGLPTSTSQFSSPNSHSPTTVFGVSGCLPIYRRGAVGSILFRSEDFMYKEDVDLAYRLQAAGHKAMIDPQAVAYHARSVSFDGRVKAAVPFASQWLSYRNHWRILGRYITPRDWLTRGWLILPYELAKFTYLCYKYRSQFIKAVVKEWLV